MFFKYNSTEGYLQSNFLVWGWRIPFLASVVMVAVGLYVRFKLEETPVFVRALARGQKLKTPLAVAMRHHLRELVQGAFIMLATYGLFYLMTTWILSYAIGSIQLGFLGIGYRGFLVLQLISVLLFAGMIPISGRLADSYGRRSFLLVVTVAIIIFGLLFKFFLDPAVMGIGEGANMGLMLLFLCIGMALMGLTFGPMSAVLPELFPTNVRYTGSGISYNISSILGAALTPFAAVWLARKYGVGAVGLYLAALGVLTFIALWFSKETKHTNLDMLEERKAVVGIESTSP